jgi:tetratricopeptide (TPR) repeat protein
MKILNQILAVLVVVVVFVGCSNNTNNKSVVNKGKVDSIQYYTNQIMKDSSNATLFALRAKNYLEKGKIDLSLRDIQHALELNPENEELFILLSDIYMVLGQSDNAILSLKKAIKLNASSTIPFLKLSEIYILLEQPSIALGYTNEALSINRYDAEAYYLKGVALLANKDTLGALNNFRVSSSYDSTKYMTFMQIGAIYASLNDTNSRSYYLKALDLKPDDERALFFLGLNYQEAAEFDKALDMYSKLISKYPDNKRSHYNMGYIYLVEYQDYDNAKDMFQKAIDISPGYVEAVFNLGRTYEATNDYEKAREYYRQALEILPNYPLAVQSLNRLDDIQYRN